MEQHVKIVSIIYIVFGALAVFAGLVFVGLSVAGGAVLSAILSMTGSDVPSFLGAILAGFGLFFGLVAISLGVFQIVVAVNLQNYSTWARIAQIVISCLGLFSFPVGTAAGAYALWTLLNKDTVLLFEQKAAKPA
jgi:hypothetical protein